MFFHTVGHTDTLENVAKRHKSPTWSQWILYPIIWASGGTPESWWRTVISLETNRKWDRNRRQRVIGLWFQNPWYQCGKIKIRSPHTLHTYTHAESHVMLPMPVKTRDYTAPEAHTSIAIIAQSFVLLGCKGSISQWLLRNSPSIFRLLLPTPSLAYRPQ